MDDQRQQKSCEQVAPKMPASKTHNCNQDFLHVSIVASAFATSDSQKVASFFTRSHQQGRVRSAQSILGALRHFPNLIAKRRREGSAKTTAKPWAFSKIILTSTNSVRCTRFKIDSTANASFTLTNSGLHMIYQLNSKFMTLTTQYDINDEQGNLVFAVKGKFFSWGDNLSFQKSNGTEIAQIRQKLFSFMPKYEIFLGQKHFATIVREFSWFKKKFTLDVPGPNDYTIRGDFWNYEYEFERSNRIVATVSRKYWSWTDSYGVNIIDGEDDVSILAAVTVVSLCNQEDRNE